jgi:hypothetical protein
MAEFDLGVPNSPVVREIEIKIYIKQHQDGGVTSGGIMTPREVEGDFLVPKEFKRPSGWDQLAKETLKDLLEVK